MLHQRIKIAAGTFLLLGCLGADCKARTPQNAKLDSQERPRKATGILLDRIPKSKRNQWESIRSIVFATASNGEALYPSLKQLWDRVDSSGHTLYVEFATAKGVTTNTAGSFQLEHFDSTGQRHIGVLRLYLHVIDRAYIGKNVARGNGFVPFEGLSTDERYVEVLGHELAHVVAIFGDLERARRVDQLIVPTNEMFYADHAKKPNSPLGADLEHRINLRDRLLDELEVDADAAEETVWHELITARKQKK